MASNIEHDSDSSEDEDDLPLSRFIDRHRDDGSDHDSHESPSDSEDDEPLSVLIQNQWVSGSGLHKRTKQDFTGPVPGAVKLFDASATELDFFAEFFPVELLNLIVDQTNLYAQQKIAIKPNASWYGVTIQEMKAWLGIRLYMSVVELPRYDMYWSEDWLFGKLFIPNVMKRDRFDSILRYFHVNDNTKMIPKNQEGHDKLFLVRPVYDKVNNLCLEAFNPHQNVSIDEAMVAYS